MSATVIGTGRAVEVLHDRGLAAAADADRWAGGSGCLIGGRLVLTAAHNVGYRTVLGPQPPMARRTTRAGGHDANIPGHSEQPSRRRAHRQERRPSLGDGCYPGARTCHAAGAPVTPDRRIRAITDSPGGAGYGGQKIRFCARRFCWAKVAVSALRADHGPRATWCLVGSGRQLNRRRTQRIQVGTGHELVHP
jgi:hypothetical protein